MKDINGICGSVIQMEGMHRQAIRGGKGGELSFTEKR